MRNIAEGIAVNLFTQKFGNNFWTRFEKFKEEVRELEEAVEKIRENGEKGIAASDLDWQHLYDELCDVQGTFTHLASIKNLYQSDMLNSCVDKVKQRETNPDYKRFR